MPAPRPLLLLLPMLLAACTHASPAPEAARGASQDEQLLFALPHWCKWQGRRQPWHQWEAARNHAPTGNGVCGVQLDLGASTEDRHKPEDGLCVEYQQGQPVRVEVRRQGQPQTLEVEQAGGAGRVRSRQDGELALEYRVLGAAVEASTSQRDPVQGPCFWR